MFSENHDTTHQQAPRKSDMVIRLPSDKNQDAAVVQIKARGGIPLLVGDSILAEVTGAELHEALLATAFLNSTELMNISSGLVESLSDALGDDIQVADLAEVAADAASLFVLCLRRYNILDIDNIPACGVTFHHEDNDARLQLTG